MNSEKVKEIKKWILASVMIYVIAFLMISTAVIIIYFPELRQGFEKFFGCTPKKWEDAKYILIFDYLLAIPISGLLGFVFKPIFD